MKKIFISLMAFAMMMTLTSCNNVESKADEFVKEEMEAASSLQFSKVKEIEEEAQKYRDGLSEEDQEKFDEAVVEATAKYEKEFAEKAEKMGKALGGALDGLNDLNNAIDNMASEDESEEDSTDDSEDY